MNLYSAQSVMPLNAQYVLVVGAYSEHKRVEQTSETVSARRRIMHDNSIHDHKKLISISPEKLNIKFRNIAEWQ